MADDKRKPTPQEVAYAAQELHTYVLRHHNSASAYSQMTKFMDTCAAIYSGPLTVDIDLASVVESLKTS